MMDENLRDAKQQKKLTNFSIIYGKCYYYDKVDFTDATYARKLKLDHNLIATGQNVCMFLMFLHSHFSLEIAHILKCVNFPTHARTDRMTHIELRRKNIIQSCLVDCQG